MLSRSHVVIVTCCNVIRCFHGTDLFGGDQEDIDMAIRATQGKMTSEDWRTYFKSKGYAAAVDFPMYFFYKDIVRAFHDVKVIHVLISVVILSCSPVPG